jgi:predicted nuclease of predicted toxin-antitoxin system
MPVALYMDEHVPSAISDQLRKRGVDVLTVQDDGRASDDDPKVLDRAAELGRVLFTQDILFKDYAESLIASGREFNGLLFGQQTLGSIGEYVESLELIAKASDPIDWKNWVEWLPYKRVI